MESNMRGNHILRLFVSCLVLSTAMACLVIRGADAEVVTFSGTVTYGGSYAADTLYVAVLDTNTAGGEPNFLAAEAIPVGTPPYSQPFSVSFDNASAIGPLVVAGALDVDGGGLATISGGDIVGWYASTPDPTLVPPTSSQTGIDFALPLAEIRGTVTFGPGQTYASVNAVPHSTCDGGSFAPQLEMSSEGAYVLPGLYAGTYCIRAHGQNESIGWISVCHGDPLCVDATFVTLTTSQAVIGVDLDFSAVQPNETASWGSVKSTYR
jgi:hypothetical protein